MALHPSSEAASLLALSRRESGHQGWEEAARALDQQEGLPPEAVLGGVILAATMGLSAKGKAAASATSAVADALVGLGLGWLIRSRPIPEAVPEVLEHLEGLGAHPWSIFFAMSARNFEPEGQTKSERLRDDWLKPVGDSLGIPPGLRMVTHQGGLQYAARSNVHQLPERLILFGDLSAPKARKIVLPRHLTILGDLFVPGSAIETLPEGLAVQGAGILTGCLHIGVIAPKVRFGGSLILSGARTAGMVVSEDIQAKGLVL